MLESKLHPPHPATRVHAYTHTHTKQILHDVVHNNFWIWVCTQTQPDPRYMLRDDWLETEGETS